MTNEMTAEEAIIELHYILNHKVFGDAKLVGAVKMAIQALEQEPILDKIIDDIQTLRGCSCNNSDGIIDDVEDIIDKYKTESEDSK